MTQTQIVCSVFASYLLFALSHLAIDHEPWYFPYGPSIVSDVATLLRCDVAASQCMLGAPFRDFLTPLTSVACLVYPAIRHDLCH